MGSTRWGHDARCCSEACGVAYATSPERTRAELARIDRELNALRDERETWWRRLVVEPRDEPKLPPDETRDRELRRAILAAWVDGQRELRTALRVWADWLASHDDPLGDVIAELVECDCGVGIGDRLAEQGQAILRLRVTREMLLMPRIHIQVADLTRGGPRWQLRGTTSGGRSVLILLAGAWGAGQDETPGIDGARP